MAETVNLHSEIEEKKQEEIKQEEIKSDESKSLDIGDNLLLPVIVMLMLNKSDLNFPILDNMKKLAKDIISLPLNIDISSNDIQVMMNAINSVEPYMNPDNSFILDKFSTFFSTLYKITTIKELGSDMPRNSSDNPNESLKFKNQSQKALHVLGTLEQFMDEDTKKNVQGFKNALSTFGKFQETTNTLNQKKSNGGKVDIKDIMQLIGPILGGGNFPDAEKIDGMIRMVQIMSALNTEEGNPIGGGDSDEDESGALIEFIIDRYDDE